MDNMYQLVVSKGPKPGQTFPLYALTIGIGRDPISDITINDPEISRQHARLVQTSDSYQIEDLQSTNGTFVNGIPLGAAPVQLAHGNVIKLGSGVELAFELVPDEPLEAGEIELETAVSAPSAQEYDPMLPPTFIGQESISKPAETDPLTALAAIETELDEAFSDELWAEPNLPATTPPPVRTPFIQFTPPAPASDNNPVRSLIKIALLLIFIMMCCCCGFLFVMYQWGGDWLLQQMGMVP
jgi:pSer/pThr/pTyr-binding forkhead associated (FHA) protein